MEVNSGEVPATQKQRRQGGDFRGQHWSRGFTGRGGAYGEGRGLQGGVGQQVQFPDTGENKAFVAQPESGGNAGMSRASSGQLPCQQPP